MENDFWLVETTLFQYLKYPFHWKQFFHLLQIYFKRILDYSQWQRIFCLVETIFFNSQISEAIIAIRGRPIFKKKFIISARGNRFLQFVQILIRMEVAFRSSEIVFFK